MIWGIFLAVLAALALLGRTRLGFRGTYTRQEVGVWFRLGAFQWRLYPWKKEKKPNTMIKSWRMDTIAEMAILYSKRKEI